MKYSLNLIVDKQESYEALIILLDNVSFLRLNTLAFTVKKEFEGCYNLTIERIQEIKGNLSKITTSFENAYHTIFNVIFIADLS
mmetsp:Transcript_21728/g.25000  ORF Transcript_21728/g.25000 Transcript_21728/m.25000 type:complete len:84 (+) Transcript_21728:274-525(+)